MVYVTRSSLVFLAAAAALVSSTGLAEAAHLLGIPPPAVYQPSSSPPNDPLPNIPPPAVYLPSTLPPDTPLPEIPSASADTAPPRPSGKYSGRSSESSNGSLSGDQSAESSRRSSASSQSGSPSTDSPSTNSGSRIPKKIRTGSGGKSLLRSLTPRVKSDSILHGSDSSSGRKRSKSASSGKDASIIDVNPIGLVPTDSSPKPSETYIEAYQHTGDIASFLTIARLVAYGTPNPTATTMVTDLSTSPVKKKCKELLAEAAHSLVTSDGFVMSLLAQMQPYCIEATAKDTSTRVVMVLFAIAESYVRSLTTDGIPVVLLHKARSSHFNTYLVLLKQLLPTDNTAFKEWIAAMKMDPLLSEICFANDISLHAMLEQWPLTLGSDSAAINTSALIVKLEKLVPRLSNAAGC